MSRHRKICCDIDFSALLNLCRDIGELCCIINFPFNFLPNSSVSRHRKSIYDINKSFLNFHLSLSSLIKHSNQPTSTHIHLNVSMNTYANYQKFSIQV